tara:strand:+ start:1687 stop:1911 length:225 start_codon:yes stop_codon:yes gene_type:complete
MREGTHEDTIDTLERLQEEKDELLAEVKRLRDLLERQDERIYELMHDLEILVDVYGPEALIQLITRRKTEEDLA